MGRPASGKLCSYPEQIRQLIKEIREEEPGYGSHSILAELIHRYGYEASSLPCRSSLAAYLKEQGLTKSYEHHSALPKPDRLQVQAPHDLWQLDGRGNEWVADLGAIALLDIKDIYSHSYVSCFPAPISSMKGHPNTDQYQQGLRLGFLSFGLPKVVQADHASVFNENNSKSPFPTRLHLWLIGLGIELIHSRVHQPTDQAAVERAHEILYNQILKGKTPFKNWKQLFDKCQKRKQALNYQIPSRSCANQAPLIAMPEAKHSKRFYCLQRETQLIELNRIYQFLAKAKWYRKVAGNKMVFLGGQSYYIKHGRPKEELEISFCSNCQHLLFQNDKELLIAMHPIKGLNKSNLMGDSAKSFVIPNFQLQIPFHHKDRVDTTFLDLV